jgi:nucleoside-specific outer membrane channel protein Tsx
MKTRSMQKTLLASTVIAASVAAGAAMAATNQSPFESNHTQGSSMQLAEMACGGAASCGGNMKKDKSAEKSDANKS